MKKLLCISLAIIIAATVFTIFPFNSSAMVNSDYPSVGASISINNETGYIEPYSWEEYYTTEPYTINQDNPNEATVPVTQPGVDYSGNKIFFQVDNNLWKNFKSVRIYMYAHDGSDFPLNTWGSKKGDMQIIGDNLYTFDFDAKGYTIQPGKQYGIIFCTDTGIQTCDIIFDSSVMGDTAYLTGNMVENRVDSNKKSYYVKWKNADSSKYAPPLCITSIGNIVGEALWAGTTKYDMLVNFIKSDGQDGLKNAIWFNGKTAQQTLDDTAKTLGLGADDIEKAIKDAGKDAATIGWRNPNANPSNSTGDCKWTLDDEGVLTITGRYINSSMGNYYDKETPWGKNIKKVVIGEDVGSIGAWAFKDCTALTSVTIPHSIKNIYDSAFEGCTALKSVTFEEPSVSTTSDWDYGYTEQPTTAERPTYSYYDDWDYGYTEQPTTVEKPTGPYYDDWSYSYSLQIYSRAFAGCTALTSITLPERISGIGTGVFRGCTSLNDYFIPDKFREIPDCLFEGCASLTDISLSDKINTIGLAAFKNCKGLTAINLSENVTKINHSISFVYSEDYGNSGSSSSGDSSSSNAYIYKDEPLHFNNHSFAGCSGLASITVSPDNPTYDSRDNCNAIIDKTNNTLLLGCKNTVIPESVTTIGRSAFEDCAGLKTIHIPDSVTSIKESAFKGTGLSVVEIGSKVTEIELAAFTGLESISVSDGNPVFNSKNCKAVIRTTDNRLIIGSNQTVVPNNVETIGSYAFYDCTGLTKYAIPNTVKSICARVFWGCTNLEKITIPDSVTTFGAYIFENTSDNLVITCLGSSAAETYAKNYCSYSPYEEKPLKTNIIPFFYNKLDDGTVAITQYTGDKPDMVIPDNIFGRSVSTLKNWLCANNTFIQSVTVPDTVTSIPKGAFYNCTELKTVTMGSGVTSIAESAFEKCLFLENINLSDKLTTIGDEAFYDCRRLKKLIIPQTVTSIGEEAFTNCRSLKTLVIPKGVTKLGEESSVGFGMFENCKSLEEIKIPASVEFIQSNTFDGCNNVTILGKKNSYADSFAVNNNMKFRAVLDDCPVGDSNGDGVVDVLDATMIQKFAVDKLSLTSEQKNLADVNDDGVVDILDATMIQKFAVDKISEFKKKVA